MGDIDPGSAREEAERLVATALAAVRLAGADGGAGLLGAFGPVGDLISGALGHPGGSGSTATGGAGRSGPDTAAAGTGPSDAAGSAAPAGGRFSTGSAECCVCPICRAMVALRDPSPEFAERLATGAGDLAAGVASLLRAFSTVGGTAPGQASPPSAPAPAESAPVVFAPAGSAPVGRPDGSDSTADHPPRAASPSRSESANAAGAAADGDQMWRAATRTRHDLPAAAERDVWAAATRAHDPATAGRVSRPAGTTRPPSAGPTDGGAVLADGGTALADGGAVLADGGTALADGGMAPADGGRATVPASRTPGQDLAVAVEAPMDED